MREELGRLAICFADDCVCMCESWVYGTQNAE